MSKVYSHPGQDQMQVEVILASRGANGTPPIYTIRLRYPRIIHGEIMTHRVFSRNARSSRAVPVKTMLNEVRTIPFIPWHWGKNQKGMQAVEECNEEVHNWMEAFAPQPNSSQFLDREQAWLLAADLAARSTEAFMYAGYHKQIPNRLLEPFSWIDTLITATDWANFLHLRDHKDAEPHLQDLARLVKQAIEEAEVQVLPEGAWHLPYVTQADLDAIPQYLRQPFGDIEFACRLSAARCARISYKPFDGDASYERELERYNQLVTSERVHASPLEHQAQVYQGTLPQFWNDDEVSGLNGNFAPGWIQFRKTVDGEYFRG